MFGAGYAAAQDRLFFIDVLRHLGRAQLSSFIGGAPANRAMDAEQWSLAPYTEADYQRQFDLGDDLYGDRGRQLQDDALNYVAGINQYIAEARLDPTKMPGEYAAHRPPAGSRRLEGDRPLLHRLARRRDLRQGRRARARRVPAAGRVQGPLRRQEGPHAVAAVRGLRRPRRADHGQGQALPVPDASPRSARGRRGAARPAARSRRSRSRARSTRRRRRRAAACCRAATCRERRPCRGRRRCPAARDPAAARRPGPARARPAAQGDVQRAARLGRQLGQRPPARGLRPAGRLLRPADPDGGGPPRAGHRRQGRRLPGREPLRPARPRPRLRLERHLGRPGHHRHLRGAAVRRDALPLPRAVPGRSRCSSARTPGRRTWPTRRRPARRRCTPSARSSASSPAAAPTRASRCSTRCCARPTSTRSTRPSASACSTSPARSARPRTSSARPATSATRSTGSTSTPSTSPTSTRATTRCGPRGRPASCRWRRPTSGATSTPTSTRRATRRSPSTRRSSTSRCSRAGTTARRPATPAPTRTSSARSSARRCSIASSRCG